LTQKTPESIGAEDVKGWPKKIKHRNKVLAKIYPKCEGRNSYRVSWTMAGKRQMASFKRYSDAKQHADQLVKDIASGSQAAALSAGQAVDALAALERLQAFYQSTGTRLSLLRGISEYCEAADKLGGLPLGEAVEGYLRTVASVKRRDIGEAVEEFLQGQEAQTHAPAGKRPPISAKYFYNQSIQLRRFAATFPNTAICDLGKEHLDTFIGSLAKLRTKSRNGRPALSVKVTNHYRASIRQFLDWSARKDYLCQTHRLAEADLMRPKPGDAGDILFYTPEEFRKLLETANGPMRAMIALGGLGGLRTAELLRLDWADVWRVPGHIEITSGKSKTRQHRLVSICPSLEQWLEPFREFTGKIWTGHEITFQGHFRALCEKAGVPRKANGLRHSFCTFHFALHKNENLTAAEAGHTPKMLYAHYRQLATEEQAKVWFAIAPERAANVIPLPAAAQT
jgi:integrase